nr:TRAP transporter small permease [Tepidanaerobacter acetatoxydans]
MFYQVVLRYIFDNPNVWAEELARYLFVWITFVGSAVGIRRNKHLTIDYFINLFETRTKALLHLVIYLIILGFLIILLKYSTILVLRTTSTLSPGMMISMAIPYSAIPVGTLLMILYAIELILKQFSVLKSIKSCDKKRKLNKNVDIIKEG